MEGIEIRQISSGVQIIKAIEQYFYVVLFSMQYKMILTLKVRG